MLSIALLEYRTRRVWSGRAHALLLWWTRVNHRVASVSAPLLHEPALRGVWRNVLRHSTFPFEGMLETKKTYLVPGMP